MVGRAYSDGDAVGSLANPWTYDYDGRLVTIPGHVTLFEHNARGQVTKATYANGVVTENTYSATRFWLERAVTTKGATVLQDVAFVRDAKGRITSVTTAGRPTDSWPPARAGAGSTPKTTPTG